MWCVGSKIVVTGWLRSLQSYFISWFIRRKSTKRFSLPFSLRWAKFVKKWLLKKLVKILYSWASAKSSNKSSFKLVEDGRLCKWTGLLCCGVKLFLNSVFIPMSKRSLAKMNDSLLRGTRPLFSYPHWVMILTSWTLTKFLFFVYPFSLASNVLCLGECWSHHRCVSLSCSIGLDRHTSPELVPTFFIGFCPFVEQLTASVFTLFWMAVHEQYLFVWPRFCVHCLTWGQALGSLLLLHSCHLSSCG